MNIPASKVLDANSLAIKLKEGSAGLFPTDTLPALASCPQYARELWRLKKRPLNKPLILMGAKLDDLIQWISIEALNDARSMARKHWPGALTLVLPASGHVVEELNPDTSTIGIRVPALELARNLLEVSGPLATSSSNLSGGMPATTAEEANNYFSDLPLLGPVPWPQCTGIASTVLSWKKKGEWQLLRKGAVIH